MTEPLLRLTMPPTTHVCNQCGKTFQRPANYRRNSGKSCRKCENAAQKIRKQKSKAPPKPYVPKKRFEVVLPRTGTARFDKKRGEWYMPVRVRHTATDEKYSADRIYIGVSGQDAEPDKVQEAYTATYARLELQGASKLTKKQIVKKRKKLYQHRADLRSWKQGKQRDLGVTKVRVTTVAYEVRLPDPLVDKKTHYVGRFQTRKEARLARDAKYREMKHTNVPCAVCGKMPALVGAGGRLSHLSPDCANKVEMPEGIRPLYQAKLWNLVFSKGDVDAGMLTKEDLYYMGYFYKRSVGWRFYPRTNVEFDLSLAAGYVVEREEAVFE